VALLGFTARSALRARSAAGEARFQLITVTRQARELVQLRHDSKERALPVRPAGGLAGKVAAALARAGLPASALQGLSPEAETLTSAHCFRERATVTLTGITLPQVGGFLDAWRTGEPEWTVSSIDLSPLDRGLGSAAGRPGTQTGNVGSDLPLRAVITLEGLFKEPPLSPTKGIHP
jgi:hypothetical protein